MVVCTAEGKGAPMRGGDQAPAGDRAPSTGGVRAGAKKMGLVSINQFSISGTIRFLP
jgi:hypothetical protein